MAVDPFSYFTIWVLLISYSIFVWSAFLDIPRWLFLMAACLLTTTSVLGTFFITIPDADNKAVKGGTTPQKVILEDALIHSGPLVLFLLLFGVISKKVVSKKVVQNKPTSIGFGKYKFIIKDHYKTVILAAIIGVSYLGYIHFGTVYFYDYPTLILLSVCVFVTSYQIYFRLLDIPKTF